ncbi:hypothetical protein [Alicyclobacillus sp. SO9]|uniref:hypothetical protein n=1 Tax=Alicyclobacillus sp. SO9 TaxID=2665646 RepID=UPI0018E75307|nr:hypothetical protein [Alicyclobacillus sp. SO9]QQE76806.1 hypothetical protein GI364_12345 [Alicyclobacillus sp. SO9]
MNEFWNQQTNDLRGGVPCAGAIPHHLVYTEEAMYRRMRKLEKKLDQMIDLMEKNNQLLESLAIAQKSAPQGGAGGTVVVRM